MKHRTPRSPERRSRQRTGLQVEANPGSPRKSKPIAAAARNEAPNPAPRATPDCNSKPIPLTRKSKPIAPTGTKRSTKPDFRRDPGTGAKSKPIIQAAPNGGPNPLSRSHATQISRRRLQPPETAMLICRLRHSESFRLDEKRPTSCHTRVAEQRPGNARTGPPNRTIWR